MDEHWWYVRLLVDRLIFPPLHRLLFDKVRTGKRATVVHGPAHARVWPPWVFGLTQCATIEQADAMDVKYARALGVLQSTTPEDMEVDPIVRP